MKYIAGLLLVMFVAGCSASKAVKPTMNGTWVPVSQEMNGKEMPRGFYEKQRLIIEDSSYTMVAESIDRGVVKVNGNKLDIFGKEGVNKGKHFTAIFKLDKDRLTVCYNLKGDRYPENFTTQNRPMFFLSEFVRAKQ